MDTPQLRFATCGHVVVAAVAAALCNVFMGRPEKNGKKRKREKGRRRWSRARGSNGKSHKKRAIGPVYVSTAAAAATKRKTGIALAVVVVVIVGRSCRAALRCFHLYCIYKIHTQTYAYLHT